MIPELHLDFETRSATDLRKTGVHVYAECPTTDVWCVAFGTCEDDITVHDPDDPDLLDRLLTHVAIGGRFVAHNAAFEMAIWSEIMVKRYGWPSVPIDRWRCTMAQAYAMALPGALADATVAVGLGEQKDMAGHRLMMSMAKPRKVLGKMPAAAAGPHGPIDEEGWQLFTGADGSPLKIRWWMDADRIDRLRSYCAQDVRAEMRLDKRLLRLTPTEQRVWVLDQKINNRGVYVDEAACIGAMKIVDETRKQINQQIKVASDFKVGAATNVNEITDFLREQGVEMEGLAKDQVEEALTRDDLTPAAREVLELRQQGSKMSVAKVNALLRGRCKDGRARGMLQYHAASTGRWGGRRFQPQNLKRPDIDQDAIDNLIDLMRRGETAAFMALVDDPIEMIGSCIRGLVAAPPGRVMGAADFANIEGRVLAWLAGENWKIEAFKAYDAGTGPDLYKLAFSRSFGKPIESVSKDDRQIGKVQELALGYQGGPGAFQAMARGYGLNIGDRYEEIVGSADAALVEESQDAWETYGHKSGMAEQNWIAAEIVKRAWREAHPATTLFWEMIELAANRAVQNPGETVSCGRLRFRVNGSFLWMQLPSGRCLCYPFPKIGWKKTPWGSNKELLTFYGQDTYTRKWGRTSTYGGKLTENAVQAIARDLLAEALLRLDDARVETVLHVHDEAAFYADPSVEDCERVCRIMSDSPEWAAGLPVAAEGWIGERYRK